MSYIYFISPVGADPSYRAKRDILDRVETRSGVRFFYPLEHRKAFDVQVAAGDMRRSQFVIGDLSLERPSCYFEVGIAQAIGVHVELIASAQTRLHQVGNSTSVRRYDGFDELFELVLDICASRTSVV